MNKDANLSQGRDENVSADKSRVYGSSASSGNRANGEPADDEPRDIFDRIMYTRVMRPLRPLYTRYKEILLYVFFGALTTVVSFGTFYIFADLLNIHELIANVISWIFAVTFAYVTNRTWVFGDKAHTRSGIMREAAAFYSGRLATLGFEELVIFIFVTVLGFNDMIIKIIATVGVLVLNYIISKLVVFKKEGV